MSNVTIKISTSNPNDIFAPEDVESAIADSVKMVQQEAAGILAEAKAGWPVASGQSRDSFSVSNDSASVSISNSADYAAYIQRKGGGAHPWDQLVQQVEGALPALTSEIEAIMAKGIAR